MTSTQPTYEKRLVQLSSVEPGMINNIYHGHFKNIGAKSGRLLTAHGKPRAVMDRYKTWHSLEYSLPPSVKDRR